VRTHAVGTKSDSSQTEHRVCMIDLAYRCSVNGEIHIRYYRHESSRKRKFPRTLVPMSESSREQTGRELARLLADSFQEANWPGSEKGR